MSVKKRRIACQSYFMSHLSHTKIMETYTVVTINKCLIFIGRKNAYNWIWAQESEKQVKTFAYEPAYEKLTTKNKNITFIMQLFYAYLMN